jgi:hypothetical protein
MQYVHFLNLEYLILLVYRAFTGLPQVQLSDIPSQTITILTYLGWAGILLSLMFGVLLWQARTRLHRAEHHGWHERDEEIAALAKRHSDAPVNSRWENILMLADGTNESEWRRAIIDADIMLDEMLMSLGYPGENLGERLKGANPLQFTTLNAAWAAHKVRNDIAHGGEAVRLTEHDVHETIQNYRRAFEEFNYL